jgi:hypothetical protein
VAKTEVGPVAPGARIGRRHPRSSAVRRCHAVHGRAGEEVCRASGISGRDLLVACWHGGSVPSSPAVGPRHGRSRTYRRCAYGATARVDPCSTPEAAFVTAVSRWGSVTPRRACRPSPT